ncbi:MAG: prolipoprotein diacylglyceryl transferase [Alphaproteobacteria bacterium]|nr:prolipoprotein diacylglyceryl transferase [Alphaproteobacteria bacterium]
MFSISFPSIDPVLIQVGPLAIRWYALAYIAGLLGAWWYILRLLKTESLWSKLPFQGKAQASADQIGDLFVWAALGVILGGRFGYVLFYGLIYEIDHFVAAPWRIFFAWEGGMSFHGGALGVVLAIILFARRRNLDIVALGDLVAVGAPIGLFFGRLANFINGELWGKPSDVAWAMVFPHAPAIEGLGNVPRHPSQLYEAALEGLVLFIVLHILVHRFNALRRPGLMIAAFWAGYGFFRIAVEVFFRDSDQLVFGGVLTMGSLLSIFMFVFAGFFFWYSLFRKGPALLTQ